MTKNGNISRTLATGGLTAAVALLAGMNLANAQAPAPAPPLSGAGSFPLSFIVPGTNTSLHVGGFVQMDLRYVFDSYGNSTSPGADFNLNVTGVPVVGNGTGSCYSNTAAPTVACAPAAGSSNHGTLYFTAQSSRLQFETRTPSPYGEVKTFIEMDFSGSASDSGVAGVTNTSTGATQEPTNFLDLPRLKQAYGTLGPWAFGQFASNYADLAAWPDSIGGAASAGIPDGPGTAFVPQIRYTYLLPMGWALSGSIESTDTGGAIGTSTGASPLPGGAPGVPAGQVPSFNEYNAPGVQQKFPSFTATAQTQQPWGHTGIHVAVSDTEVKNLGGTLGGALTPAAAGSAQLPVGGHLGRWGYQVSETGHLNTWGTDKVTWNFEYGQGADGYAWDLQELGTQWVEDLICSLNGTNASATGAAGGLSAAAPVATGVACSQPRNWGLNLAYTHHWTDEWRSTVDIGYNEDSKPNAAGTWIATTGANAGVSNLLTDLERRHITAMVNAYWTPVAGVQMGLEYQWWDRVVWSGARGQTNQLAFQTLFAF